MSKIINNYYKVFKVPTYIVCLVKILALVNKNYLFYITYYN